MASAENPNNSSASSQNSSQNTNSSDAGSSSVQMKAIPLLSSLNQSGSVRLDRSNFLLWRSLVLAALRGHRMDGYVLGNRPAQPEYVAGSNDVVNPAFEEWLAADQIIYSWLLSTMTPEVASEFLHCKTACEMWNAVIDLMSANCRSRITMYRYDLQRTCKGGSSITEYLSKMKLIADNLAMAGSPIPDSDLITQTLAGLDAEYTPLVVCLSEKENLTWIDMHSRLLTFEKHLEHLNSVNSVSASFANVAISSNNNSGRNFSQQQNSFSRGNNSGYNNNDGGNNNAGNKSGYNRGGGNNFSGRSYSQRSNRGGRGRGYSGRSRPTCQVCSKQGHTALKCYYRFDHSFSGQDESQSVNQGNTSVYIATPATLEDPDWYVDSGATNHITHYDVPGAVETGTLSVGNGQKLPIVKSASASYKIGLANLSLQRVLVVPNIKKNLVSVAELTQDNDVIVEFDSSYCFVKDKQTRQVLLRGIKLNGLYKLPQSPHFQSTNKSTCTVLVSVLDDWHRRLGHASFSTVKRVLQDCNIRVSNSAAEFSFCEACQFGKSHALPFKSSTSHSEKPLYLIHTDLWGPAPIASTEGYKYYVCFVDDYSRFSWIFPLHAKSEAFNAFLKFKVMAENLFDTK